jgi:hypothetical protein
VKCNSPQRDFSFRFIFKKVFFHHFSFKVLPQLLSHRVESEIPIYLAIYLIFCCCNVYTALYVCRFIAFSKYFHNLHAHFFLTHSLLPIGKN